MPHRKQPFLHQKPILYFDENFPHYVIDQLKRDRKIKKYFKICSAFELGTQNKDDNFQYQFARKKRFALVTLDHDFMNDHAYPIEKMWGVILIIAGKNQVSKIRACLLTLIDFISWFPLPKAFMRDSKFQVSLEGCVVRGRDVKTNEIKTVTIMPGDTITTVADHFHYFG